MGSYEDYDRISKSYDRTREPVGVEVILGCLAKAGGPLSVMRLLDAGCGTGNYARALIDFVDHIEAVDINRGMLSVATRKLKAFQAEGRVVLHQSKIDELPFKEGTFDAVMINQVLHHLEDQVDAGYPAHRRVFGEFHRVLRSGGILIINTCSHAQLREGFWHYHLIPEAVENICARYVSVETLQTMLKECGFTSRGCFVPVDAVLWGKAYFDPYGPLKKEWRDGDSIFALVTDEQLKRVIAQIRGMDAKGELSEYLREYDRQRKSTGQVTFMYASRS